ncbi:hypothetical protein BDZ89DRAFT_949630 [Hymenopellis radicata]|nr:hypothetical protein BDZ89DRAFT_949630 [Hymenopellis radicata]
MPTSQILLQYGSDPFNSRYEDVEGRSAFTLHASETPNLVIKLTREALWAQQHPTIMGPSNSYFYFGPRNSPGYVVYGNTRVNVAMAYLLRQQREGSSSRYFMSQSGKLYKWRISQQRMECMDGRNVVAVWDLSHPDHEHHATLTIKPAGLLFVTEILTTLILNRMAQDLNWC